MSPDLNEIAEIASEKAVARTFRMFGVDINDMDAVNALRDDMAYTRAQRLAVMQNTMMRAKTFWAAVGAVAASAIVSAIAWMMSRLSWGHQ